MTLTLRFLACLPWILLTSACSGGAPPPAERDTTASSYAGSSAGSSAKTREATTPESEPGDRLTLMTWNVEFMWDGLAPEDGDADFPWKGSPEKAAKHMAAIAEILEQVNPDLVNLVEVEDRPALALLAERFLPTQGYRPYLVPGEDTATGQDVGLLSRFEVTSISRDPRRGRSGEVRKGVSKHYVATLDVAGLRLGLVGLHLLANPDKTNRRAAREAQADAILRMARELEEQGRSVIVWGDFNDFDGSTLDAGGSRPITRVLENIRAMDPDDPRDDLVNVTERLPRGERFTTRRRRGRSAIDHILVSPELAERIVEVTIPHPDQDTSDHDPIVVVLRLDPRSPPQSAVR